MLGAILVFHLFSIGSPSRGIPIIGLGPDCLRIRMADKKKDSDKSFSYKEFHDIINKIGWKDFQLKDKQNLVLIILAIFLCLFCVSGVVTLYRAYIGEEISTEYERWAGFGSFIGGVFGSIFSFISFIILLFTYRSQRKEDLLARNREIARDLLNKEQRDIMFSQRLDALVIQYIAQINQFVAALGNENSRGRLYLDSLFRNGILLLSKEKINAGMRSELSGILAISEKYFDLFIRFDDFVNHIEALCESLDVRFITADLYLSLFYQQMSLDEINFLSIYLHSSKISESKKISLRKTRIVKSMEIVHKEKAHTGA